MYTTNIAIWLGVDKCAKSQGLTCAGLAKRCGLNATVFNKSKRSSKYDQARWLSTGTLDKIADYLGITLPDFFETYVPRCDEADNETQP